MMTWLEILEETKFSIFLRCGLLPLMKVDVSSVLSGAVSPSEKWKLFLQRLLLWFNF